MFTFVGSQCFWSPASLVMFTGCTAQGNGPDPGDKIAGFLFDCFAFVFLRRSRCTVMTSQYAGLGRLDAASIGVNQGKGGRREQDRTRWWIDNENDKGRQECWNQ